MNENVKQWQPAREQRQQAQRREAAARKHTGKTLVFATTDGLHAWHSPIILFLGIGNYHWREAVSNHEKRTSQSRKGMRMHVEAPAQHNEREPATTSENQQQRNR